MKSPLHGSQGEAELFRLGAQEALFSCAILFGIAQAVGVEGDTVFDPAVSKNPITPVIPWGRSIEDA